MNTNRGLWYKVLRAKYRKYAFRISAVAHIILFISVPLFLIDTEPQVLEDEIQVELIRELPRQIVKKKPPPIPKEEPPEPPKPEIPQIEADKPERRKMTSEKEVTVVQPKPSVAVAKLSASPSAVDIEHLKRKDSRLRD